MLTNAAEEMENKMLDMKFLEKKRKNLGRQMDV